jgi:hypothetical protein
MQGAPDPTKIPEWHAVGRECSLVRQLIGSGATALGEANYANKKGEYYTAFFGLSVGLERLTKLIIVVDHAIEDGGRMPSEAVIRKFGHKLSTLIEKVEEISKRRRMDGELPRPSDQICAKIIEALDSFADARKGRYANFLALDNPNLGKEEPIARWWGEVAELILHEHYYGTAAQARVEARAKIVDAMIGPISYVQFTNEIGDAMSDAYTASVRSGESEYVQRYGRFYSLVIVRWLAGVFSALSEDASYRHGIHAFAGAYEYFQTYTVEDRFLKTRKRWPLT